MRDWWRFCEDEEFATNSRMPTCKKATWEAHARIWRVFVRLDFASHSWVRPSCEWLAKLSAWWFWVCLFIYLYQYYINSYYPRNCKKKKKIVVFSNKFLREKTLAKHLRVRDCLPTIIYTISLKFPLLLPLHLHILERFLSQTLISPILSVERSFGVVYGKH